MNKKLFYGTTTLTVIAVSGYLYYRHNKVVIDQKIQALEDKVLSLIPNLDSATYPEPEEVEVNG